MKFQNHKGFLLAALFTGLSAQVSAGISSEDAALNSNMFMCTEEGSIQPQFLAWTDADHQLLAVSAIGQVMQAPSETNGTKRVNARHTGGVRTVKMGYHIARADKQANGVLEVSGIRYGCALSYEE